MRQRYCIFLFLALLISCSDENNPSDNNLAKESVLTVGVENVTDVGAVLKGKVSIQTASYDLAMGFQYSTSSGILPSNSIIIIATDADAQYNFTAVVNNLNPETKYYFRAFVRNNEKEEYGETKEFTTSKSNYSAIDLGLGVKWGNCNLGAKTPEEAGGYYAWGEIETKSSYSWSNYKWCHGTYDSMSKYNTRNTFGGVDELVQLEQQDDAAHHILGGKWRMPTDEDWSELISGCTWTWTTQNSANGYTITSNTNGRSIFLPAVGSVEGTNFPKDQVDFENGRYWSSSLNSSVPSKALFMRFDTKNFVQNSEFRYIGIPIRPVQSK